MPYKKILFITLLFSGSGTIGLKAQETIPASGINVSGSGGSVSCTVGQIACTSYTSAEGSVAQGVQQAYEFSVIYGIEESTGIMLQISIFPNQVSDILV
jgi:large exoprotein involved in heme utilization and adhesion